MIGLALLVGLVFIRKYWKTPSSLILLYLLVLFVVEYYGLHLVRIGAHNQWLYNLSGILELSILSIMFYLSVKRKRSKVITIIAFVCCLLFILYDAYFLSIYEFWNRAYGVISLGISAMCVVYLLELATMEKVVYQNRILLYWVSIGLLIYQLVILPVTVIIHNLEEIGNADNLFMIQLMAGITMYFCFIIGFIWTRKQNNS